MAFARVDLSRLCLCAILPPSCQAYLSISIDVAGSAISRLFYGISAYQDVAGGGRIVFPKVVVVVVRTDRGRPEGAEARCSKVD